jgi:hypothetical protein
LDENQTIRQDLVENVDYVILPRSLGYFFHDVYQGGRRLKTKNRHIYITCDKIECKKEVWNFFFKINFFSKKLKIILFIKNNFPPPHFLACNKHDLKSHLKVFEYLHLLDEEKYLNLEENKKMRRDECHIFSWC